MSVQSLTRRAVRRLGYDIQKGAQPELVDFLRSRNIDLVIDVGANTGQFGSKLRRHGFGGDIVSFEPVSAAFQHLAALAEQDPRWAVHKLGLGNGEAELTINVSENTQFSSFLPLRDAAKEFDPQSGYVSSESVAVTTLDRFFSRSMSGAAFLKIDTQGFERQVLEGAKVTLSRVSGILLELPITHLYEGTWSLHEALAYMAQRGFVPAQIKPVNFDHADPTCLLEIDCIFRRG